MLTALSILCCGIPAAVCWMIIVEEFATSRRRITLARMVQRGRDIFGAGLLSHQKSAAKSVGAAVRLFAWTAALGSVLAEMSYAWPAADGLAIWLVVACGALEIVRYLPVAGDCGDFSALLGTMMAWLAIVCALTGLGLLFGSFNLAVMANIQAQLGCWTAVVQPLGCSVFVIAAWILCLTWIGQAHDIELIEYVRCIVLALLAVWIFSGGWHFWGISTYTTDENISSAAAFLRAMVVIAKLAVVLCGMAIIRTKRTAWRTFGIDSITGNFLLAVAGANLMIALAAETWLRPEDFMTRGLLSWIVAGGMVAYGLMFHRTHATEIWKVMVADKTETGY